MANVSADGNLNVSWALTLICDHDTMHIPRTESRELQLRFALAGQHLRTVAVAVGLGGHLEGSTVLDLSSIDLHGAAGTLS